MLVWRKLSSAKWEDVWLERLSFLDLQRIVISTFPGAKTIRIEAYDLKKREAAQLTQHFGGQLRVLKNHDFVAAHAAPQPPLRIRDKLIVVRSESDKAQQSSQFPHRQILVIPAAMAFGTGDHATTATCLRFLCEISEARRAKPWDMLDLGTGSGILACTARLLGARRVDAFDFDPVCVRTTRANAALNNLKLDSVQKVDVLNWQPARQWDVVTANLYSEVLIAATPQITRALNPGGTLILSGIMRAQENGCRAPFRKNFAFIKTIRRGKWVTIMARRIAREL